MSASWTRALIGAALLLLPGALLLLPVLVWWRHRCRTTSRLAVLAANAAPGSARDVGGSAGAGTLAEPFEARSVKPGPGAAIRLI